MIYLFILALCARFVGDKKNIEHHRTDSLMCININKSCLMEHLPLSGCFNVYFFNVFLESTFLTATRGKTREQELYLYHAATNHSMSSHMDPLKHTPDGGGRGRD